MTTTYDHRVWKIGLPVRSDVLKPQLSTRLEVRALSVLLLLGVIGTNSWVSGVENLL